MNSILELLQAVPSRRGYIGVGYISTTACLGVGKPSQAIAYDLGAWHIGQLGKVDCQCLAGGEDMVRNISRITASWTNESHCISHQLVPGWNGEASSSPGRIRPKAQKKLQWGDVSRALSADPCSH